MKFLIHIYEEYDRCQNENLWTNQTILIGFFLSEKRDICNIINENFNSYQN